jgi:hypothetical protein
MPLELSESRTQAVRALKEALSKLETEEGRMAGVNFSPRASDVIVATPPKARLGCAAAGGRRLLCKRCQWLQAAAALLWSASRSPMS